MNRKFKKKKLNHKTDPVNLSIVFQNLVSPIANPRHKGQADEKMNRRTVTSIVIDSVNKDCMYSTYILRKVKVLSSPYGVSTYSVGRSIMICKINSILHALHTQSILYMTRAE